MLLPYVFASPEAGKQWNQLTVNWSLETKSQYSFSPLHWFSQVFYHSDKKLTHAMVLWNDCFINTVKHDLRFIFFCTLLCGEYSSLHRTSFMCFWFFTCSDILQWPLHSLDFIFKYFIFSIPILRGTSITIYYCSLSYLKYY